MQTRTYITYAILLLTGSLLPSGALTAQTGFSCDGRYFLALRAADQTAIYAQRPDASGSPVLLRNVDRPLDAVGFRPQDGLLYGIDAQTGALWRIGRETFAEELYTGLLDPARQYPAGDIGPAGRYLYVLAAAGSASNSPSTALIRVDLDDPAFAATETALDLSGLSIADIAFDPTDGTLYGWDGAAGQLQRIGLDGTIQTIGDPQLPAGAMGGLFFDAFGKLYGYGKGNLPTGKQLFVIDKLTGGLTYLRDGPQASYVDAGACYQTLELQAATDRVAVDPCEELRYVLRIANRTGSVQTGVTLRDTLPVGFRVAGIDNQPYGGNWDADDTRIGLRELIIPVGIDSLVLRLDAPAGTPPGYYTTQAVLEVPALGIRRHADNARTGVPGDSVGWQLNGILPAEREIERSFCAGGSLVLDAAASGTWIDWTDGYTDPVRTVAQPSTLTARVATGCDTVLITYRITPDDLYLAFEPATVTVALGDSLRLFPLTSVSNTPTIFRWRDPLDGALSCLDCPRPFATPVYSSTYTLEVSRAGCIDSASVTVLVESDLDVYLPTAFSPNEDGVNDKFYPQGNPDVRVRVLELYNRWGEPVFIRRDLPINVVAEGWDGTYRGLRVDEGVYVYHVELEARDGSRKRKTGSVALMR